MMKYDTCMMITCCLTYALVFIVASMVYILPDGCLTHSWVNVFRFWCSAVGKDRAIVNSWVRQTSAADKKALRDLSGDRSPGRARGV